MRGGRLETNDFELAADSTPDIRILVKADGGERGSGIAGVVKIRKAE